MASTVRKTSGRYRLVFVDEEQKKTIPISCDPLTGKILYYKNKKSTGADLTILDMYILKNFQDEESLRTFVKNLGYPIPNGYVPKVAYQHNSITNYLELIYENNYLYDLATLCHQYKMKFSNYASKNNISAKELRKLVSREISHEPLWKDFYDAFISQIHEPDFYTYISEEMLLGERAIGFITDYLNNESCADREQQEAFNSARYYLIDTFTAYKPIRGMIVSRIKFLNHVKKSTSRKPCSVKPQRRKTCYFGYINPFKLLTEPQLRHLEDHSSFNGLSRVEQEDMILGLLGLTEVPWYERTIYPISEIEANYLEDHSYFSNLSYLEKIRFVNNLSAKQTGEKVGEEDENPPYQKKKV